MISALKIKKVSVNLATFFLLAFAFLPIFTYGVEAPNTTGKGTGITYECVDSKGLPGNCDFNDLIAATKKAVNYVVPIALSFTVVVIAWAGFLYMKSGDNPSERTKANKMLQKVAIGIFFIMAAWLIVTLITNALLEDAVKAVVPLGN